MFLIGAGRGHIRGLSGMVATERVYLHQSMGPFSSTVNCGILAWVSCSLLRRFSAVSCRQLNLESGDAVILRQSTEIFGRIQVCRSARLALGNMVGYFVGSHVFDVWVLPCGARKLDSSGDGSVLGRNASFACGYMLCFGTPGFWTIVPVLLVDLDSDPEAFLSVLTQIGEVCSVDASGYGPCMRCLYVEIWNGTLHDDGMKGRGAN